MDPSSLPDAMLRAGIITETQADALRREIDLATKASWTNRPYPPVDDGEPEDPLIPAV